MWSGLEPTDASSPNDDCCFLGPKQAASQLVMKTECHYALYQLYCMHLKILNAWMVETFFNPN